MNRISGRPLLLLGAISIVQAAFAQAPAPGRERPVAHPDRVLVKLREGTGAVLNGGRLTSRSGADLSSVAAVFAIAERAERAISLPLETLDRWHRDAVALLPDGAEPPGHLGLWFRLIARDAASGRELVEELRLEPAVQEAHLEPIPYLACSGAPRALVDDLPPPTPDFSARQTYRGPAPTGVDAEFSRRLVGGRGRAIRTFHVEADWVVDHEDLDAVGLGSFIGPPTSGTAGAANHGTGVLGVLVAGRNGYGVTGMVELTTVRLIGWAQNGGIANSIALAADNAQPGDVGVLIVMYQLAQTGPDDWVPAEYYRINFDAILTATTRGLILVEAAANGDNDLDDPRFARRFDLSFRNSGAVMVGATDGPNLRRADFSNFGSRIDANGWGDQVTTTGYGTDFNPGDPRQHYTFHYAGTSSATAMVSAAVASLSSAVAFQEGRAVTSDEVRAQLRAAGTDVPGAIGKRPDLRATLARAGLPDGLITDRYEVRLGTALDIAMTGPDGASFALVASPALANTDLGLNRPLHLDPTALLSAGTFVLTGGSATLSIPVPNDPALATLDLYFQGVHISPGGLHVTNSCAVFLR